MVFVVDPSHLLGAIHAYCDTGTVIVIIGIVVIVIVNVVIIVVVSSSIRVNSVD